MRDRIAPKGLLVAGLLGVVLGCGSEEPGAAAGASHPGLRITPHPGGASSAALEIRSPLQPEDLFELRTVETVLDGDWHIAPLFGLSVPPEAWRREGETLRYTWRYPQGPQVEFRATPGEDHVALSYTVLNTTGRTLERVHLHPCLPTTSAASYFPGTSAEAQLALASPRPRPGRFFELNERLVLWSKERPFTFAETSNGRSELHTSVMRRGEAPIVWAWWRNAEETFDLPLIALRSKDGRHTLGLGFERAIWASSNVGDTQACIHLFPYFGRLEPGEAATVRGGFYVIDGPAGALRDKFLRDFELP